VHEGLSIVCDRPGTHTLVLSVRLCGPLHRPALRCAAHNLLVSAIPGACLQASSLLLSASGIPGRSRHMYNTMLVLLQVAEICVDALSEPAATNKVVEIVADQNELVRPAAELFSNVQ